MNRACLDCRWKRWMDHRRGIHLRSVSDYDDEIQLRLYQYRLMPDDATKMHLALVVNRKPVQRSVLVEENKLHK